MKKKIILFIVLCTCSCKQNTKTDNVALTATLSVQKVYPEKGSHTICKHQNRLWITLHNSSSKNIFLYSPALIFLVKRENKWVEDYEIFNRIWDCDIKLNDNLMDNWVKYQMQSKNFDFSKALVERYVRPKGLNEIQKKSFFNFIFLKPNDSITYPFIIPYEFGETVKVYLKSSPDICLGMNNSGFIMSKYKKRIPDKFESYEYLKEEVSSKAIQIE
ncbi:MAG: hypothetical protein MUF58_02495 [Arcicella sp.]|jgi:hypothetical protein|nr:hypothetical protein [Arcicella sp.]